MDPLSTFEGENSPVEPSYLEAEIGQFDELGLQWKNAESALDEENGDRRDWESNKGAVEHATNREWNRRTSADA